MTADNGERWKILAERVAASSTAVKGRDASERGLLSAKKLL
jgi:hypothetical protein